MEEFIKDILVLEHEPLIPDENEKLLKQITSLERTSQFDELNITEEKLDELIENLGNQEDYTEEIGTIVDDLDEIPGVSMANSDIDVDFI